MVYIYTPILQSSEDQIFGDLRAAMRIYWMGFQCKHKKMTTISTDFCVVVIQPINIGEQERQGMRYNTIV